MYNVLDVCRFIIKYSNDNGQSVSNLKLQKLLYFIQAYYLQTKNEPCFREKIEAWNFGPVVRRAYMAYKQFGGMPIPTMDSEIIQLDPHNIFNFQRVPCNYNVLSKEDKEAIGTLLDAFKDFSAAYLVDITHQQSPWVDAYEPYRNKEITLDSMRRYFCGKKE